MSPLYPNQILALKYFSTSFISDSCFGSKVFCIRNFLISGIISAFSLHKKLAAMREKRSVKSLQRIAGREASMLEKRLNLEIKFLQ